jgi:ParB family transcriptional regulator, chromosome partitioning protein
MPAKRFTFDPIPQPSAPARDQALTASPDGSLALAKARLVPLSRLIADPDQPRKTFPEESLRELADSILAQGMRQPITAYYDDSRARFVVISGERRLRAATLAGLAEAPVLVEHRPGSESEKLVLQLAENLVREDLAPLEAAAALGRLKELQPAEWRNVAARHGINARRAYQLLELLTDPADLRAALERGAIKEGHAAELRRAPAPERTQLLQDVIAHGLSVADTRKLIAGAAQQQAAPAGEAASLAPARGRPAQPVASALREPAPGEPVEAGAPRREGPTAGAIATAIEGTVPPEQDDAPRSAGAAIVEEKERARRSRALRQRLKHITAELHNVRIEEVSAEYTALPEIIVQARQARDTLDAFIALLERIQLDQAGGMEQPPA